MKNRFLIFALIIMTALAYSAPCLAYTKVTQSETNEAIVIEADGHSPFETVPVMILKEGKTLTDLENATKDLPTENLSEVVGYMTSLSADKDGRITNETTLTGFETGKVYEIIIGGTAYRLKYETNAKRNALISEMISAADANDPAKLQSLFTENKDSLSIDNNILAVCDGLSDASITALLMKEIKGKGTLTIDNMADIINKSMLTAALNAGKPGDKEIVDHIMTGGQYDTVNSALKDKIKPEGLKSFISRVNNKAYASAANADEEMAKELILDAICDPKTETTSEILSILNGYNGILGLDLSKFNKLSSESKGNAIRNFANKKPTLETMQTVLDGIVSSLLPSETQINQSTSGGGGGGGSAGGGGAGGTYMGMTNSAGSANETNAVFNDIGNYPWAKDAILSLYSSGIISGYGNGVFAPQNSIKREEFVKIVVAAFYGGSEPGECAFFDVSPDAWYYKSIAVAANCGIISGIGDNLFGVGKNITRQDMAVILSRIAGDRLEKPESYNSFSDDGDIAGYAKEAVYALRAAGVINGVSATEFAPLKNATRAETAVMIYRFLNLIGKGGV